MAHQTINLATDYNIENNLRAYGKTIGQQLINAGFVKTSDVGQIWWDQPMAYATSEINSWPSTDSNHGSGNCYNAFDTDTSSGWACNLPTSLAPQELVYDAGVVSLTNSTSISYTATQYQLYFSNQNYDPYSWTLYGSNDKSTWNVLDTQTKQIVGGVASIIVTAGGSGYTDATPYYNNGVLITPLFWTIAFTSTLAAATIGISGGGVDPSSVTISNAGSGFLVAPDVYLVGGDGTGATAIAVLDSNGTIAEILVTNVGTGYSSSAPTVCFSGGGQFPIAYATVAAGAISSVVVTDTGRGMSAAPTPYLIGGGGGTGVTFSLNFCAATSLATYPILSVNQAAYRYYKISFTNNNGNLTYMWLASWNLYAGSTLFNNNLYSFATRSPSSGGNWTNGYEIYAMNDTLALTLPVYIKVEYGTIQTFNNNNFYIPWQSTYRNGSQYEPVLLITAGTGTDGVGNLIGIQVTSRQAVYTSTSYWPNASSLPCYFSYDSVNKNRFIMALWSTHQYQYQVLAIERLKDSTGSDTANGLAVLGMSGAANWQMVMPATGSSPTTESQIGCIAPTSTYGLDVWTENLYKITPFLQRELYPMLSCNAYFNSDIPALVPVSVTIYGNSHTFLPLGNYPTTVARANANTRMTILWE